MAFKLFDHFSSVPKLQKELEALRRDFDDLKSRNDLDDALFDQFFQDRASEVYLQKFSSPNPLVTVCIATYNRSDLLVERSIKSVLDQTYRNIELIVVGDCCTDDTERRVAEIRDSRLIFHNLPQRGHYPAEREFRWMVAGSTPMNHALALASGDFITHLDDDDAYLPERIERLTAFIQEQRADIIWHPFWDEVKGTGWKLRECPNFKKGNLTTSAVLYHSWLKRIPWDLGAYRYREPGDWNRFRKFAYLGVKAVRYPQPLLRHYLERSQRSG